MTAQVHEDLIYEGEKTSMAFCPPLPATHPRIVELSEEEARDNNVDEGSVFSTACWREYIGTWEIKDGRFYLVDLKGVFKLDGDEPLFADWFTGVLRIPEGEMLHYVHMGFGSVFERERLVKIESGVVTKTSMLDNREKEHNLDSLNIRNLPGWENEFKGDDL